MITNDVGVAMAGACGDRGPELLHGHLRFEAMSPEGDFAVSAEEPEPNVEHDGEDEHGREGGAGVESTDEDADFPPNEPGAVHEGRGQAEMRHVVAKLRQNMGHLSQDGMIAMLRAAGAKDEVLAYVRREFRCDVCGRRQ